MKHCIEDIEYLLFKLRIFGVLFAEERPSTYVWCDNKKHSAIAFTFKRWNVSAGVCTAAWITTGENIVDAMTKQVS